MGKTACSHPGWRMKGGLCVFSEEKKNIFLTYGANRFLLKCLDYFDKRFFFALHIFAYFFLFLRHFHIHSQELLFNAAIWEEMDIMWLETSSADFTNNNITVNFSSFPFSSSAVLSNNKNLPIWIFLFVHLFAISRSLLSTRTHKPIEMINLKVTKRRKEVDIV